MATFTDDADFDGATFTGDTRFSGATLPSTRYAGPGTPSPWIDFDGARLARGVPPEGERFVSPPNEDSPDARTGC